MAPTARASSRTLSATAAMFALLLGGCGYADYPGPHRRPAADYVGSATCASCHSDHYAAWRDSLHAWAMRPSGETVASYEQAELPWGGDGHAACSMPAARPFVDIDDGQGEPERYRLAYFLGHRPIEQHLVELEGGRIQALPLGFDTTLGDWFDIFPGDARKRGDWGHWRGRGMNANAQCLYCHTTGFAKGYVAASDSYESSWAETGVGCEACHGPGSRHVEIQTRNRDERDDYATVADGLLIDMCASCHGLRREIAAGFLPGERFLDYFDPVLLDEDDYHGDGQVDGEDFEWGSFVQSRMFAKGVTCIKCHDAHTGKLRGAGNSMCLSCHQAPLGAFRHTHHAPDTPGSLCVSCHMPPKVYMARDERRDHSLRIPDPQATIETGVPNACDACHADKGAAWAAEQIRLWAAPIERVEQRRKLTRAFVAARSGAVEAIEPLIACLRECSHAVRRASAAKLLARFVDRDAVTTALIAAAGDSEALVRAAAAYALSQADSERPAVREALVAAAGDEVKDVRMSAAWGLRAVDAGSLTRAAASRIEAVLAEWEASTEVVADQAETWHTLGVYYSARGRDGEAEAAYRRAIALAPRSVAPRQNLAMLLVALERPAEAERELDAIVQDHPDFAPARYGLGVIQHSRGDWRGATAQLLACLRLDPTYPGALRELTYTYLDMNTANLATMTAQAAARHPPSRPDALEAMVAIHLRSGEIERAHALAEQAVKDYPRLALRPDIATALVN